MLCMVLWTEQAPAVGHAACLMWVAASLAHVRVSAYTWAIGVHAQAPLQTAVSVGEGAKGAAQRHRRPPQSEDAPAAGVTCVQQTAP